MIKCKCQPKNGERIFHLPTDQQYDTIIGDRSGACYAETFESRGEKDLVARTAGQVPWRKMDKAWMLTFPPLFGPFAMWGFPLD